MTEAHPFAMQQIELIWEGKYDTDGKRVVAPLRVELPFQTVDMVRNPADTTKAISDVQQK
jgi:hypothetical protein